jgi:hypothetical protein
VSQEKHPVSPVTVAWRVRDFADGWIIFQNKNDAFIYASSVGAAVQELCAIATWNLEEAQ